MCGIATNHAAEAHHSFATGIEKRLRGKRKLKCSRHANLLNLGATEFGQFFHRASFEGEVTAGQPYTHLLGNGLIFFLQPIHSGWILRVLPATGPAGDHDYAELATPPYQSVTPLSLSTDFSFRAQDAVGWNPRRFRFATSKSAFDKLADVYQRFEQAGATPPAPLQVDLSTEIAQASEASLTLLDVRLIPGTADQSRAAATVASHFAQTAHTVVQASDTPATPLGNLLWIRFRVDLNLPRSFPSSPTLKLVSTTCPTQATNLQGK